MAEHMMPGTGKHMMSGAEMKSMKAKALRRAVKKRKMRKGMVTLSAPSKEPISFKGGALHEQLSVPAGEKIPSEKKASALAGRYGPLAKKRAVFAFRGALAKGRKTAQG